MLGLKKENGIYIFKAVARTEMLFLNLYRNDKRVRQIPFDRELRIGDVWRLEIPEDAYGGIEDLCYAYEADGSVFTDPNGPVFSGRKKFGNLRDGTKILKTPVGEAVAVPEYSEEWKKDRPVGIPYDEMIIYRLHVRGFTAHSSSGLPKDRRGTFQGIIDKIPYLKDLGINAVELMPPYEFNEVMLPNYGRIPVPKEAARPTGRINYWGFTSDALQLAPKSAFTSDHRNPKNEFQNLILKLHENGIEIIIDLYFTDEMLPDYVNRVMRYWRVRYHVDGIHIVGRAPYGVIARDPYLSRFKIWADSWEGCETQGASGMPGQAGPPIRYLADYNDGFQNDMRRILKGDGDMLWALMARVRQNPSDRACIQYMANVSGMTMMDMVSYDRKHNEDNQEQNRDGTDENHSWNCGEEGKSRKKAVNSLRRRMLRNAFVLLLLSQGTPLISAGDEFGHSKLGNNNSYCQDNGINWLDWDLVRKNRDIYEFVKYMIHFRQKHKVFHQAAELRNLDYKGFGIPDISFHGENAWRADMENYRRELGVMYAGAYADDETFLVLYNFHWERHDFGLPHPPSGTKWEVVIDTAREDVNGICNSEAVEASGAAASGRKRESQEAALEKRHPPSVLSKAEADDLQRQAGQAVRDTMAADGGMTGEAGEETKGINGASKKDSDGDNQTGLNREKQKDYTDGGNSRIPFVESSDWVGRRQQAVEPRSIVVLQAVPDVDFRPPKKRRQRGSGITASANDNTARDGDITASANDNMARDGITASANDIRARDGDITTSENDITTQDCGITVSENAGTMQGSGMAAPGPAEEMYGAALRDAGTGLKSVTREFEGSARRENSLAADVVPDGNNSGPQGAEGGNDD